MFSVKRLIRKLKKQKKYFSNSKGLTLLELIVVVALGAIIISGVAILIQQGRGAVNVSSTVNQIRVISTGLAEYKTYRGGLPRQNTIGNFPPALNSYIPTDYRAGGRYQYGYACNSATRTVTIRTPAFEDTTTANNVLTKLIDQGNCGTTSTVTAGAEIDCMLPDFNNTFCQ